MDMTIRVNDRCLLSHRLALTASTSSDWCATGAHHPAARLRLKARATESKCATAWTGGSNA